MRCSTNYRAISPHDDSGKRSAGATDHLAGGRTARYFAELKREDDVREAAQFAKTRDLPLFVLGGGSNLVVADSGWPGLVLRIAIGGITSPKTSNQ